MYYLQSRYYNPEWGRFINGDDTGILQNTQGELLSANLYSYCANNPVNNIDPNGLSFEKIKNSIKNFVDSANQAAYYTRNGVLIVGYLLWEYANLPKLKIDSSQIQKKFKHAIDFGITGNYSKYNAKLFEDAIIKHVNSATNIFKSVYRGQDVYVYIKNGVGVYTDLTGKFISGWKFNIEQINFHIMNGIRIK